MMQEESLKLTRETQGLKRFMPRGHAISWWMLLVTTGAILITSIDRAILPAVLPGIIDEFHLSATDGGMLVSLSFIGTTLGGLLLGIFGDTLGRGPRRAWSWLVMVAVVIASSIATAFSKSLWLFKALRVTMGIGTGGMEPVNVAMVGEWWQKENRGFAIGAHHTGFPIGQFLGPIMIGVIIAAASWRSVFLVLPLLALPIVVVQIVLARRRHLAKVNDWIRANGMTPSLEVKDIEGQRFENPLPRLMKIMRQDRNVALGIVTNFLFLWTEAAVVAFLTLQLTRELDVSLAQAAAISGASGLTGWIGQILWGIVSDHRGRKFSLNILAIGSAVTIFAMSFMHSVTMAWVLLIGWGLFRNSPYPVLYAAMIDTLPKAASSGLGLMVGIGLGLSGVIAAPVAGWLIDHYGFGVHYGLLAALCLIALIPIKLMRESAVTID